LSKRVVFPLLSVVVLIAVVIAGYNLFYSFRYPKKYDQIVTEVAARYALSPALVMGVIHAESGFRADAHSPKGAEGLMQVLPDTARGLDIPPETLSLPPVNIEAGTRYLAYLRARFPDRRTYLAAYNAGEGRVAGWLRDPAYSADGKSLRSIPYEETRNYVERVTDAERVYRHYHHMG
jgi:soluble lytic murein transglycosylase